MKHTKFMATSALAITAATVFAGAGQASQITINSITPQWVNEVPNVSVDNTANPAISLRWGTSTGSGQSGYDFTPENTPFTISTPDTPFLLGNFDHLNFPITGTFLESVDLSVDVGINGVASDVTSVFEIDHNETPNIPGDCPGETPPCDDIVTISDAIGGQEEFTIGDTEYVFSVLGFSTDGGNTILSSFSTVEGQENPAGLYASFTASQPAPIPLPAAGWMLLAGIGGLAAMRRRKKA